MDGREQRRFRDYALLLQMYRMAEEHAETIEDCETLTCVVREGVLDRVLSGSEDGAGNE